MILKFTETLQFRLIFKIKWSCSFSFRWQCYSNCVQIQPEKSSFPRGETGKRYKITYIVKFLFFGDIFLILWNIFCPDTNVFFFLFKDGKDFGNWEWKEVGKLSSVKSVQCGTST